MHYNKRTVAQRYVSKKIEALSTQYFLTIKFKSHSIVNSHQKNSWQNKIPKRSRHESNIAFSKKHTGTIFNYK